MAIYGKALQSRNSKVHRRLQFQCTSNQGIVFKGRGQASQFTGRAPYTFAPEGVTGAVQGIKRKLSFGLFLRPSAALDLCDLL